MLHTAALSRRAFAVLVAAALAFACAGLTGCFPAANSADDPAAQNRLYISSVNRISAEAASDLAEFDQAAANGDVAAMRLAASQAKNTLGKIAALEAPEPLAEVHAEYMTGTALLCEALSDYVEVYAQARQADEDSEETYASELADIQAKYDSAMTHIAAADTKVAELAGSSETAVGDEGASVSEALSGASEQ